MSAPSSAQSSPRPSRHASPDPFMSPRPSPSSNGLHNGQHNGFGAREPTTDELGTVHDPATHGLLGGLGVTHDSTRTLVQLLQASPFCALTRTPTHGDWIAVATAAATATASKSRVGFNRAPKDFTITPHTIKPMLPMQPIVITEHNWQTYLGDERLYPNFLTFFSRLINAKPLPPSPYAGRSNSLVPVLEKYLLGGYGEMLTRAVSGAIHGLINIGFGIEFGIPSIVAEGLAQSAITSPRAAPLFPSVWPPHARQPSQLQSTLQSAFSSLRFGSSSLKKVSAPLLGSLPTASPSESFAKTAARLDRSRRIPRNGLSGFTILDRMLNDPDLAPGRAGHLDDFPKLDGVLARQGERIVRWCEEWKFEAQGGKAEWDEDGERDEEKQRQNANYLVTGSKVPSWTEIVEKTEELFWMATVIFAAMHGLTSVLFLPPILEVISPHLRPYLLHSHFRVLVAYWISRGRPELHIHDTLMAASANPRPPHFSARAQTAVGVHLMHVVAEGQAESASAPLESPKTPQVDKNGHLLGPLDPSDENSQRPSQENPWPRILASAADHPDDHLCKVVRSLAFAAMHFGHSSEGIFQSALPGTDVMDGSIFSRAAGLVMQTMGWCHEGEACGKWDRSCLGYDEAWDDEARDPNHVALGAATSSASKHKGKGRSRSGTETEETYLSSRAGSVATSPVIPQGGAAHGWYQSSTPERVASPVGRAPSLSPSMTMAPAVSSPEIRLHVQDEQVLIGNGYGRKASEEEDEEEAAERLRRFEQEDEDRELMA
ncbi:hypothetical protein OIV83_003315 [Microbotryomycetes sp. JL201]|nr:hypothetical protein OIV83_003315 [Microbotryomycetes sp. JL201]